MPRRADGYKEKKSLKTILVIKSPAVRRRSRSRPSVPQEEEEEEGSIQTPTVQRSRCSDVAVLRGKEDRTGQRDRKGLCPTVSNCASFGLCCVFCPNHTRPTLSAAQQQLQPPSSHSSSTLLLLHPLFPTVLNNLSPHIKLKTSSHSCV